MEDSQSNVFDILGRGVESDVGIIVSQILLVHGYQVLPTCYWGMTGGMEVGKESSRKRLVPRQVEVCDWSIGSVDG